MSERSVRPASQVLRDPEPPAGPRAGLQGDIREGDRCPRPNCGGLLVQRRCVTLEGMLDELVCTSCSRGKLVRLKEAYRGVKLEAFMKAGSPRPEKPRRTLRGISTGVYESSLPPDVSYSDITSAVDCVSCQYE